MDLELTVVQAAVGGLVWTFLEDKDKLSDQDCHRRATDDICKKTQKVVGVISRC